MATSDRSTLAAKVTAVRTARGASFVQLVDIAELDRARAFRFADLSGVDLRGQDLRGFDFTGADFREAFLDPDSLAGAVITDARFGTGFRPTDHLDMSPDDLSVMSEGILVGMLRALSFGDASDFFETLEKIGRDSPKLLSELIKRAPDAGEALKAIRRFFRLEWSGPESHRFVRGLIVAAIGPEALKDAIEFVGYAPTSPSELGDLLKSTRDFETANFVYKRFERMCSSEHLILLGAHVRSPADHAYLLDLASLFSSGKEQELIALRALPSAQMVRYALDRYVTSEIAFLPAVQVVFAEKARRAEEVLELLAAPGLDRPLRKMVDAAMESLKPREAHGLVLALAGADTPLRVGGDIWPELLLKLYRKRTDEHWRSTIFNDPLQWGVSLADVRVLGPRAGLGFRDMVELMTMFTSVLHVDLHSELSQAAKSRRDAAVLLCGVHAARHTSGQSATAAIQAFRGNLSSYARSKRFAYT